MRTRGVVYVPAIGVADNDLFIDGIGLLIISLPLVTISLSVVSLTWFSAIGDIMDCEMVECGAFDVTAVSIGL